MKETYLLNVGEGVIFDSETLSIEAINIAKHGEDNFHVLKNHKTYSSQLLAKDFNAKTYTVEVNGNVYEVNLQTELDQLINKLGFSATSTKEVNAIKAPMPGLILEVNVTVGQQVNKNDSLLILEAMKMENNLSSPRDGVIKSIQVNKGDTVDKG